ncbi:sodium:solute symporter family protein [Sporosarcina cascadiensis]|uniref:sodium:solute symporter family protein n=1 Tax=Sporosarcina cascadiensis TaxID=2660747 RepID=UPI00129B8BA3|nr:sodium:solute symporter family protein [Sporosarcina cascadiensis]
MTAAIPTIMILSFFLLMIFIIRNNLGVRTFNDYATANQSFGFIAITFSVLSTWYTGAMYTAWAGMTISYGFIALYVVAYASITLVIMYFIIPQTYVWSTKYRISTQPELFGFRYQSKTLRILMSTWGILFTIPWLIVELVTQGIVFFYATGGLISQFWGMVIGITVVVIYVSLGGMRSVVTANMFQGVIMIIGGSSLMVFFMYKYFSGYSAGMSKVLSEYPLLLTYPGPGWEPSIPYWTSIVILSGLGGFMWPWAYNKLFAGDSVRSLKMAALTAPIIGGIYYALFVISGLFLHSFTDAKADPQGAFLWIASESGPFALGLLGIVIMATSVGTVSGIIQAISTVVSRDLAPLVKKNITDKQGLTIARIAVLVIAAVSIFFGTGDLGLMVFLALASYDGIILLFPVVILGLYWKRANKVGAITGLLVGTGLSMVLRLSNPGFIDDLGWQPGVYGMVVSFAIMIIAGYSKKPTAFAESLWNDIDLAYKKADKEVKLPVIHAIQVRDEK